jgi:hypothetical protein
MRNIRKTLLASAAILAFGIGAAQAAPARHTFAQFFQSTCTGTGDQTLSATVPTGFAGTLVDAEAIFSTVPASGMDRAFTGQGSNAAMDTRFGVMGQGGVETHPIGGFPGFNFTGVAYPAIGVPVVVGSPVYVDVACSGGTFSGYAFYTVIF